MKYIVVKEMPAHKVGSIYSYNGMLDYDKFLIENGWIKEVNDDSLEFKLSSENNFFMDLHIREVIRIATEHFKAKFDQGIKIYQEQYNKPNAESQRTILKRVMFGE